MNSLTVYKMISKFDALTSLEKGTFNWLLKIASKGQCNLGKGTPFGITLRLVCFLCAASKMTIVEVNEFFDVLEARKNG